MNKKIKTLFTILFILIKTSGFCQFPHKISYQAIIRNSDNTLLANTTIGMQISILQASNTGMPVYVETQIVKTNEYGLVHLEIGSGTVMNGNFINIDWANGPYFIKTETDPMGGNAYVISGTSELLSVPYALYALNSKAGPPGPPGGEGPFYLGQDTLGGIVFYIYIGRDGYQHGLIVSKLQGFATWQAVPTLTLATSSWDGISNFNLMTNSGSKNYILTLGAGWYLPSIDELALLWRNRFHANKTLRAGNFTLLDSDYFWSSTEDLNSLDGAFIFDFSVGYCRLSNKKSNQYVRAIRAF